MDKSGILFTEAELGQVGEEDEVGDEVEEEDDYEEITIDDSDDDDGSENYDQNYAYSAEEDEVYELPHEILSKASGESDPLHPLGIDLDSVTLPERPDVPPEPFLVKDYVKMIPEVLGSGPPIELPPSVESMIEKLRSLVGDLSSRKLFSELTDFEKRSAKTAIAAWQKKEPKISDRLFKQLLCEVLTYICVKPYLTEMKSVTAEEDDGDLDIEPQRKVRITDRNIQACISNWFNLNNTSDNEILELVRRLRDHEAFIAYKADFDLITDDELSALVWRVSVQAQRLFIRMCKLNANCLESVRKLSALSKEAADRVTEECSTLETVVQGETNLYVENTFKLDSTFTGRKLLYRALCSPYLKTWDGLAAPKQLNSCVPFRFQDIRDAQLSDGDQVVLQDSVVTAYIIKQTAHVTDRCAQMLLQCKRNRSVFFTKPMQGADAGIQLKVSIHIRKLLEWKENALKKIRQSTIEDVLKCKSRDIDWHCVASKMRRKIGRVFTSSYCEKVWNSVVAPKLRGQTINTMPEIKRLMRTVKEHGGKNWRSIAKAMGNGVSEFECFRMYKKFLPGEFTKEERLEMNKDKLHLASKHFMDLTQKGSTNAQLKTSSGFMSFATACSNLINRMPNVPLRVVAVHYSRFINPVLKKGAFKPIEDVLLIVTLTKLRQFLIAAENFTSLQFYLPWRNIGAWNNRADVLFNIRKNTWSMEEDLAVLKYISNGEKFDYKKMSPLVEPGKGRKTCRYRYLLLKSLLETQSFSQITEWARNKSRSPYTNFEKFIPALTDALNAPKCPPPTYDELLDPSPELLRKYLRAFDKETLQESIDDLVKLADLAKKADSNHQAPNEQIPKIDRRKFVRGCAVSTASALTMRMLSLRFPPEPDLSEFEQQVYKYFKYFACRARKVTSTQTKYLPKCDVLLRLAEIKRIVVDPETGDGLPEDFETDGIPLKEDGFPILDGYQPIKRKPGRQPKKPVPKNIGRPRKHRPEEASTSSTADPDKTKELDPRECVQIQMDVD